MLQKLTITLVLFLGLFFIQPQKVLAVCGTPISQNGVTECKDSSDAVIPGASICQKNSSVCCSPAEECGDVFPLENIIEGPDNAFFDSLNPLKTEGSPVADQLSTPGGIVSRILQFLFPLAGLVLFVMLIWGGFEILMKSAEGTKGLEAGKNRITAAIVGFLLLFATYWMAQIIEVIFGIVIV